MSFPTDPPPGGMTLRALHNPATVDRDRLLQLIAVAGLKGSAVWDAVSAEPPGWMKVDASVVKALIERAAQGSQMVGRV